MTYRLRALLRRAANLRAAITALAIAAALPAQATDTRVSLGFGRLFTNDFLGDGKDRWRTGSYVISHVRGPRWDGARPERFGEVLEFRFRSAILAPSNLASPALPPADRPHAGTLSFGLHSHWRSGATEFSAGGGLVVTGPQTGLASFQRRAHKVLGMDPVGTLPAQIGNGIYPQVTLEAARPFAFGGTVLRPYAEAVAGPETLLRLGADVVIGGGISGALMLRDVSTGHLYQGTRRSGGPSMAFVVGGDAAWVHSSLYLPASEGLELTPVRTRLRAGLHWQGRRSYVFAGAAWLGPEFTAQSEGQIVGSLNIGLRF